MPLRHYATTPPLHLHPLSLLSYRAGLSDLLIVIRCILSQEIRLDAELGGLREFYDDLMAEIHSLRGQLELCSLNSGSPGNLPQDCWEAYEMGFQKSGRYTIQPRYWGAIQVILSDFWNGGRGEGRAGCEVFWIELILKLTLSNHGSQRCDRQQHRDRDKFYKPIWPIWWNDRAIQVS